MKQTHRRQIAVRKNCCSPGCATAAIVLPCSPSALLIPKIIHLRRSERFLVSPSVIALGISGASLVLLPPRVVGVAISVGDSWTGPCSLAPSCCPLLGRDTTADEKARELGALVVVNGGEYQPGNAPAAPVKLFTGRGKISGRWTAHFQPLLVIPVRELDCRQKWKTTPAFLAAATPLGRPRRRVYLPRYFRRTSRSRGGKPPCVA